MIKRRDEHMEDNSIQGMEALFWNCLDEIDSLKKRLKPIEEAYQEYKNYSKCPHSDIWNCFMWQAIKAAQPKEE